MFDVDVYVEFVWCVEGGCGVVGVVFCDDCFVGLGVFGYLFVGGVVEVCVVL